MIQFILMSEPPNEQSPDSGESAKPSIEQRLTEIATELGFSETPELTQIRGKLAPSQLIDESIEIIIDYQRAAEQVIEKGTDSEDPKSQIGLIVALAGIKHANGFVDYREDLNQAVMYATNIGDHETVRKLRGILFENYDFRKREL